MKVKSNIAVSEQGFLFDPNTGDSYSLNASGREIVNLLSQGKTEEEMEAIILEKYEISSNDFQRTLEDFSQMLRRFNLVEL